MFVEARAVGGPSGRTGIGSVRHSCQSRMELAARLRISQTNVVRLEEGDAASTHTLQRIANAVHKPVITLACTPRSSEFWRFRRLEGSPIANREDCAFVRRRCDRRTALYLLLYQSLALPLGACSPLEQYSNSVQLRRNPTPKPLLLKAPKSVLEQSNQF